MTTNKKLYTSEVLQEVLKMVIEDYLHTYAFEDNDTKGKTFQEMGYTNEVLKAFTYEDLYDLMQEHLKYLESEG